MPVPLVRRVIGQSETRETVVRAMALLCGARVLAAADSQEAKQAFAEGVAMAEGLPLDAGHRGLSSKKRFGSGRLWIRLPLPPCSGGCPRTSIVWRADRQAQW